MSNFQDNLLDVEINSPGTFHDTSVIVNGQDLSGFCTGIELSINGNSPLAIVKLSLLSNVKINGKGVFDLVTLP